MIKAGTCVIDGRFPWDSLVLLTPWISCHNWLGRLARSACTNTVLCRYTELVLCVSEQLRHTHAHIQCWFARHKHPALGRVTATLNVIAGDGSSTVSARRCPGKVNRLAADVRDCRGSWSTGHTWTHNMHIRTCSWPYKEMVFISKQSMPEPIITNFRFSLEPSVTGTNFPQMHFRLKIWTCLKKTLSILPMSCPTTTNCYLLSAFILHYTNLVSSLFSPFLTNNTLHLCFSTPAHSL